MLRLAENNGWWLITHPDHAHLAGDFARAWGNDLFLCPEPRAHVLNAIRSHDDGWAARDAATPITREGKPAAFSSELVGKYSAFEEIDLQSYLTVRRNAVQLIAAQDPYAAILISMHTHNLLGQHADRSTIKPDQLALLDNFLDEQLSLQQRLRDELLGSYKIAPEFLTTEALRDNFRLLQACDNLSLLSCVDYPGDATLLHPLRTTEGPTEVHVHRTAPRTFRLNPYPFAQSTLTFQLPARFVPGETFPTPEALRTLYEAAPVESLRLTIEAGAAQSVQA
jgi:hypothetical protein